MIAKDKIIYQKAYKELYNVIQNLTLEEKEKIPIHLIQNIKRRMDNGHMFYIDKDKSILEQNLMPETQALIIELYQKYLSPEEDKCKWKKYNQICFEKNEEEKRKKYSPDSLFTKKKGNDEVMQNQLVVAKNKNLIYKIFDKIRKIFKIK